MGQRLVITIEKGNETICSVSELLCDINTHTLLLFWITLFSYIILSYPLINALLIPAIYSPPYEFLFLSGLLKLGIVNLLLYARSIACSSSNLLCGIDITSQ